MIGGAAPRCFLAVPRMIVPAALTKTLIFPGSILPTASNPHAVAPMIARAGDRIVVRVPLAE